jgi:hypothetical protein
LQDQYEDPQVEFQKKTKKEDIRKLEEFVNTKRPADPFKDIDPLTQKVDISREDQYKGSSEMDIF